MLDTETRTSIVVRRPEHQQVITPRGGHLTDCGTDYTPCGTDLGLWLQQWLLINDHIIIMLCRYFKSMYYRVIMREGLLWLVEAKSLYIISEKYNRGAIIIETGGQKKCDWNILMCRYGSNAVLATNIPFSFGVANCHFQVSQVKRFFPFFFNRTP